MDELAFAGMAEIALQKLIDAAAEVQSGRGFAALSIPKRHGGSRRVLKPAPSVDTALTAANTALGSIYIPPPTVHGYVRGRGTISNATPHLGQPVVLCLDLKDFFSSVSSSHVRASLAGLGLESNLTGLLEELTCVRGALPAGFPTSPTLSNIVFQDMDIALEAFAQANALTYTRYADDMSFSGRVITDETLAAIESILTGRGWSLNSQKSRFMRAGGPQYVTGLYVGLPDQPRIPRRMKRLLRMQLYFLQRYGYDDCHARSARTFGHKKVWGWIHYVNQLEPELAMRFSEVALKVDFDQPGRIDFDDEWDALLDELNVPEGL